MHENATHIIWENLTEGDTLWTGYPVRDDEGNLETVTIGHLYRTLGVKIYPDHVYRVTVHYENSTADTLAAGGMGVVAGVFMPSRGGPWPRADATNDLYALDRLHYLREVRGPLDVIADGGGVIGETAETDHGGHAH
jgi:hypothetical protein